ncbi:MAG TPA: VWA domain-containing protein [Gaiellaceae bacterium]|nr:VWA domain-containing protein [Gaiellaceae bacterium]
MLGVLGVSFLTPLDGLFVLVAAVPLGALVLAERRAERIRRLLRLAAPSRRALVPVVLALVLLPALVAVAAAQPVVVRQQLVSERADAQAFVVLDTSLSMEASGGPGKATRLMRAKKLAVRLQSALPDVPMGIASMTDRALPNLLPTTDQTLFDRTIDQSVHIDSPPPSQAYRERATTFDALIPLVNSHFYSSSVQRRLVVVFTDGEATKISPLLRLSLQRRVTPVFVHVWAPGERIYRNGRALPGYVADPTSTAALAQVAELTGGPKPFAENDLAGAIRASRDAVGRAGTETHVNSYARVSLAPWFVLAGVVPLGFLFWRRNL